jgi:putative component of toxin-antitoxin plasmid stabilization module
MNYAARENQGYRALYNIFRDSSKVASQLRSKYISIRKNTLAPAVEAFGKLLSEGATKAQLDTTSRMLNVTTRIKGPALTDAIINKIGSLVTFINGEATPNQAVFDAISKQGRFTLEDFKKGFKYTEGKERPMNDTQRNKLRAERDAELAKATTDIEKNSINKSYTILIDAKSYTEAVPAEFPAMPSLTEKSYEWIMYNENRDAMDQSAMDLLLANFAAAKGERANVEIVVKAFLGRALSENNKKFLQTIEEKYIALRSENSIVDDKGGVTLNPDSLKKGDKFLEDFNKAVLGLMTDRNINVAAYFKSAEADDITTGIEELKKDSNIIRDNEHKFVMQQAIANLALFEQSKLQAEQLAKQTIAGGYAPFGREGIWEVRINAVDPTSGYVYKVSERYREQLLYMQLDSRADSDSTAARVNGIFAEAVSESSDGLFEVEVLDGAEYVVKKVKLVAVSEAASTTVSSTAETNLNEVIATVSRFGINLTPAARTKLILGLTNQNNRARSRLRRSGTPGEDIDTIKYISKHLESISSTIAKKRIKHRLDRLFDEGDGDSNRLWRGDKVEYERRKKAWATAKDDAAMSEVKKAAIKREFDDMHYTYVYKESPIMGNRYKDRGRRLVSFMDAQKDVDFTDFGSGEVMGKIRGATTFAQLGLSPATAILNYLSLATNVLPALAAYNPKNAFGGGFGWSRASIEMSKALRQTKNMEQSKSSYWDGLLADDKLLLESGFSRLEARFMQKEVAGGTMQAALYNAQMGSARGKLTSGARRTIAEAWMGLFNYSEQAARRSTGLATFRMAFDRAIQEGNDTESAFEIADQLATDMIDNTLGEYAMYNRPALFRGDVRQFIFQYKLFVVNSIEMLLSLPRKQQLLALGIIMMFSGLKGLPFADDLMDLLDTVAQALGLGSGRVWKGSAEATVAEFLNDVMPGMTPIVMRGLLNNITPANVSDRVSLSNVVPGTGFALSGADKGRELLDIAGPVASFLQGAVVTGVDAARWGILEPIGISPDVTSLTSIARNSPITMLRAAGDLSAYTSAGAIVNRKGYVVSNNLTAMTYLTRALGFYPSSATKENDVVRVATRISDYQKDISAVYKGLYVSAVIAGDSVRAREVVDMVDDWNESAKGTGLEVNNFEKSANKAVKEAKRPASARYLKSTPKAMRPETERLLQIYGVEEEPI